MSTKWKSLTGELDDVSCSRNGKVQLENSTIFYAHEVESLTRELYYISYPQSGKV